MGTCFPGGSDRKVSACSAGDPGSIPGLGRSPREGNGNPLQDSCLENSVDWGAWQATYSPWGHKESDTTERFHFHFQLTRPANLGGRASVSQRPHEWQEGFWEVLPVTPVSAHSRDSQTGYPDSLLAKLCPPSPGLSTLAFPSPLLPDWSRRTKKARRGIYFTK